MVYPRLSRTYGILYATEYGVKADGSTDDIAALKRMTNDLDDTNGGMMMLPYGDIKVNSAFNLRKDTGSVEDLPFKLIGQSAKGTMFKSGIGAGTAIVFGSSTTVPPTGTAILFVNPSLPPKDPANPTMDNINGNSWLILEDLGVNANFLGYAGTNILVYGTKNFFCERTRTINTLQSTTLPVTTQIGLQCRQLNGEQSHIINHVSIDCDKGMQIGTDWTHLSGYTASKVATAGLQIINSPYMFEAFGVHNFVSGGNTVMNSSADTGFSRVVFLYNVEDEGDPSSGRGTKGSTINNVNSNRMLLVGCEQRNITSPPAMFTGTGQRSIRYIPPFPDTYGDDVFQQDGMIHLNYLGGQENLGGFNGDKANVSVGTGNTLGTVEIDVETPANGFTANYAVPATLNNVAGRTIGSTTNPIARRDWRPRLNLKFRLRNSSQSNFRFFAGLSSTTADNMLAQNSGDAGTPGGNAGFYSYCGIWVGTDDASNAGNYKLISSNGNGSTATVVSDNTGVAADNSVRQFSCNIGPSGGAGDMAMWAQSGWQKAADSAFDGDMGTFPALATNLVFTMGIKTIVTAAIKKFYPYEMRLDSF